MIPASLVKEFSTGMFRTLNELRSRPLPDFGPARALKAGYREHPIAVGPTQAEPLASAEAFGLRGRNHYAHDRNPPYFRIIDGAIDAVLIREGVGRRLADVDRRLAAEGLRLHLFDAWRPRAVQAYFHDVWTPRELRRRMPEASAEEIAARVATYWSAPTDDPARPAPHATGAAVDLTLAWEDGAPLYMGSLFDEVSALAAPDHFEALDEAAPSFSAEEARANRRLLFWVMTQAGFVCHPDEWWHYSYGDQLWARLTGAPAALYGLVEP